MRVSPETKSATRKKILDVAQKLFAEQGFDKTTTRDIASAAHIATGTLFNYFATKEAVIEQLVAEACEKASAQFSDAPSGGSFEEELFAHIAFILRKLKPLRKHFGAVLETALSPLAADSHDERPSMRAIHLETVTAIAGRHRQADALSTFALHLYWTLYVGVLAFWTTDSSPRQEDTLALLDQSLGMYLSWLTSPAAQKLKG